MITYYLKNNQDEGFSTLSEPCSGCWIHIDHANSEDIQEVADLTNLNQEDLLDCLDRFEVPRIEKISDHIIIFVRHPTQSRESGLFTSTFAIIITKDYFITVSPTHSSLAKNLVDQIPPLTTFQTAKFLIYILLKITQDFTLNIKRIRASVLQQEKELSHIESEDIINLTINEENLNQYLSTLLPLRAVLESINSGKYTILHEKDQDLLDDLLNASIQSEDLCSINLRSIRSLRDSYQILFTNQLNKTIKLLTALTIILSIPTMIASLYGMNVSLPLEKNPQAFLFISFFIIMVSVISYYIFQRRRWL